MRQIQKIVISLHCCYVNSKCCDLSDVKHIIRKMHFTWTEQKTLSKNNIVLFLSKMHTSNTIISLMLCNHQLFLFTEQKFLVCLTFMIISLAYAMYGQATYICYQYYMCGKQKQPALLNTSIRWCLHKIYTLYFFLFQILKMNFQRPDRFVKRWYYISGIIVT